MQKQMTETDDSRESETAVAENAYGNTLQCSVLSSMFTLQYRFSTQNFTSYCSTAYFSI
jgi:hypothetical protein